jgi:carbamoyl-phosphate synthase small subunit
LSTSHKSEQQLSTPALLALADGTLFKGYSVGVSGSTVGEIIFNTSMSGYQEIITDPSYAQQIITFTYPHIGNVGVNELDQEANEIFLAGVVLNELSPIPSNWRATQSLSDYLVENNIVAIEGIDTRALTHILRDKGAQGACIMTGGTINQAEAIKQAQEFASLNGKDLAIEVTTKENYEWNKTVEYPEAKAVDANKHVVVYDFGVKQNILRLLVERGCRLTVVPANTSANDVLALKPDGVCLSNGPGDPAACDYAIKNIRALLEQNLPLFGICLGFQLFALACGARTEKMKFGHHGANHPERCEQSRKVLITSQNHGFCVSEAGLPQKLKITHRSLFDGSLQGLEHISKPAFGFQGHPEASPGPHDVLELFDKFIRSLA